MAKRTGVPSLMQAARVLCLLITKFTPVIQRLYGNNESLMEALAARTLLARFYTKSYRLCGSMEFDR